MRHPLKNLLTKIPKISLIHGKHMGNIFLEMEIIEQGLHEITLYLSIVS